MSTLATATVWQDLINAGFSPAQATTMTAIAGAESSYDPAKIGDTGLEDNTWGPSFGLFQIRTVRAATGTGGDRDINWLAKSTANQAAAARTISQSGTDYTPWSAYTSGAWSAFLPGVHQAAGMITASDTTGSSTGSTLQTWGITAAAGLLAVALIAIGATRAAGTTVTQVARKTARGTTKVAAGAALL